MWMVFQGIILSLIFAFLLFTTDLSKPIVVLAYIGVLIIFSLLSKVFKKRKKI